MGSTDGYANVDHDSNRRSITLYKTQKGMQFTDDEVPLIHPNLKKHLTKSQKEALPYLVLDCRTYGFNMIESMIYIQKRMGRFISKKQYNLACRQLANGEVTDEWLRNFARIGFALVHQELLQTSISALHDTNRRILRVQNMDKDLPFYKMHFKFFEGLEIELRRLQLEQMKEVLSYTMGTPVIAQIKSLIRTELILQERQKMIDSGMDIEQTDYEILQNIFKTDVQKGKLNIRQLDKYNLTNTDEFVKNPDQVQQHPERDLSTRQEFESNRPTTDRSNQSDIQQNGGSNNSPPTTEQTQKELDRINKAKRDFVQ